MNLKQIITRLISYARNNVLFVVWLIVVGFLLSAIGRTAWQNYQINQEIASLRTEIEELENERVRLENWIAYLKTDSFKELEARRKLNYKRPNEKVLLVPEPDTENPQINEEEEEADVSSEGNEDEDSQPTDDSEARTTTVMSQNFQDWWGFLFGP